jgi:hypothetical protein
MVPQVLKGIMRYFKVSWVHGLGLRLRVEASIYLLWSLCVVALECACAHWEGHPWHSKNRSKIMLRVLFSHTMFA